MPHSAILIASQTKMFLIFDVGAPNAFIIPMNLFFSIIMMSIPETRVTHPTIIINISTTTTFVSSRLNQLKKLIP